MNRKLQKQIKDLIKCINNANIAYLCKDGIDLEKTKQFPAFIIAPDGPNVRVDGGKSIIASLTILGVDHCPKVEYCAPIPKDVDFQGSPLEWATELLQGSLLKTIKSIESILTDKAAHFLGDGFEYCYSVVSDWDFVFDCLDPINESSYPPLSEVLSQDGYCGAGISYSIKGISECPPVDYGIFDIECLSRLRAGYIQERKQSHIYKGLPKIMIGTKPSVSAVRLDNNNFPSYFRERSTNPISLLDKFRKSRSKQANDAILKIIGKDPNQYFVLLYNQLLYIDKK